MHKIRLRSNSTEIFAGRLQALQQTALLLGGIGLVLTGIGAAMNLPGFFHSYLYAYLFWFGVTAGSLGLLMLHHVTGGGWGYVIRPLLESGSRLLLPMAVLFLPVVLGMLSFGLYEWARPEAATDTLIQAKSLWLNPMGFIGRAVVYFLVWIWLARRMNALGAVLYERSDRPVFERLNKTGAFGLVLYVITMTFAGVDWLMSLMPHWNSSIFGLLVIGGQALATLTLMVWLLSYISEQGRKIEDVPTGFFRDLGNLMLAMVMLWAYLSFSQYLIIYSGNLAEEIPVFLRRAQGGWGVISLLLIAAHFAIPFLVLLVGSGVKQRIGQLAWVAAGLVVMRFLDLFWWVAPTFHAGFTVNPADLGAPLLLGGIWLWLWAQQMKNRPLVPLHDPRLQGELHEVVVHG